MVTMNRNIITAADVHSIQAGKVPQALRTRPPAWTDAVAPVDNLEGSPGAPGVASRLAVDTGAPLGPGGVPVPTADDYLTKLLKFVPIEVVGAYLFITGAITSHVKNKGDLAAWLGYSLIGLGVATPLYMWRVLGVVRRSQLLVGVLGFGVYVFAIGGWFGTTPWYQPWYSAIALPAYGLLVAMVPVPALKQ